MRRGFDFRFLLLFLRDLPHLTSSSGTCAFTGFCWQTFFYWSGGVEATHACSDSLRALQCGWESGESESGHYGNVWHASRGIPQRESCSVWPWIESHPHLLNPPKPLMSQGRHSSGVHSYPDRLATSPCRARPRVCSAQMERRKKKSWATNHNCQHLSTLTWFIAETKQLTS